MAIEAVHAAIADHQDPQSKAMLAQCLQALLKVQATDYQNAQQAATNPKSQVMSQMQAAQ